jgi:serpin B
MSRFGSMLLGHAGSVTAVELPYKGDHLAMLFLLPDGERPADLDAVVTGSALRDITAALAPKHVQLALPKFTFSAHEKLIPALQTLGIHQAFIDERADFHGMADEDLVIGAVEHEVFIRVDEKGTEAAAATGVAARATSAPVAQETVTFDRPFAFVLRDRPTGAVLVAGRVIDPS